MEERKRIDIPGENWHIEIAHKTGSKILFAVLSNNPFEELKEDDKKKIMQDIGDFGKWRVYKKLKKDLENGNG